MLFYVMGELVMDHAPEKDIDNLLEILDGFCAAEGRRIKLNVSEELASGEAKREYHQ